MATDELTRAIGALVDLAAWADNTAHTLVDAAGVDAQSPQWVLFHQRQIASLTAAVDAVQHAYLVEVRHVA